MMKKELLAVFLLLYGFHDALEQEEVQVIKAYEGDESVSLPFIMPQPPKKSPSLLWRRGKSEKVHQWENQKDDHRQQSLVFKDRTWINPDGFQTGNLTLVLKKPIINDTGSYTCVVKENYIEVARTTVVLAVTPRKVPVAAVVGGSIAAVLIPLIPVILLLCWKIKLSSNGEPVTVSDGDDSASLPYHIPSFFLSCKSSVEWRRGSETVHLREKQRDVLSGQSAEFKDRTEMNPDALETGNLTLTLKDPRVSDSGIYTCVVKVGPTEVRRTSVELRVRSEPVTVSDGDDSASLPFHIPSFFLSCKSSVEWRRGSETVHLREKQRDDLSGQSAEFKDRTEMNPDALETGNLTLTLKDPRVSDSGIYTCVVKVGPTEVRRTSVELRVKVKEETVSEESPSVSLTLNLKQPLKSGSSVLWRRESETVHLREEQGDVLSGQSAEFKDRTEMSPDALKTGDLTLTLKDPRVFDSGIYTCVVKVDSTEVRCISVKLTVRRLIVTSYEGDDFVSLPFKDLQDKRDLLSCKSSVVWRREGPPSETVHIREEQGDVFSGQSDEFKDRTEMESDSLETGDLTLTLKDPRVSDSGIYSCVVKNDSTEVRRTYVLLRVEVKQVTVCDGDDSVALPFRIWRHHLSCRPSVEWRRESKTVHIREEQGDVLSGQSDEFKDRTEMNPDALETGDLMLTLKDPRVSDSGIYTCVVKKDSTEVRHTSVKLTVRRIIMIVDVGDYSAPLPFRIRRSLLSCESSVEWRRGSETVHLREKQRDVLSGQSAEFKDRTEMKPDALETGDLTLTLKDPRVSDSGIYTCVVKVGPTEVRRTSVELRVTVNQVTVSNGDDSASLPFHIPRFFLLCQCSVEWRRGTETVHLREKQRDVLSGQSAEFKDRTEMNPDALETRDVTLTLKDPRFSDSGIYTCVVKVGSTEVGRTSVELTVNMKEETVSEGSPSVSLTLNLKQPLKSGSSVLWRRGSETVHLREEQGDVLSGQSAEFKDRTEMNPDALKTGDLTLTLKDPRVSDSGIYTCVVKVDSTEVRRTSGKLRVRMKVVTESEGSPSVSLTLNMKQALKSGSSVLWTREGPLSETVHLKEKQGDDLSGQSAEFKDRTEMNPDALETGDLTLTLKDPRVSDSGIYSCVVKKDSTELRCTSVKLKVRRTTVTELDPDNRTPHLSEAQAQDLQLSGAEENFPEKTRVQKTSVTELDPDPRTPLLSEAQAQDLQLSGAEKKNFPEETWVEMGPLQ